MAMLDEEVNEGLADFCAGGFLGHSNSNWEGMGELYLKTLNIKPERI